MSGPATLLSFNEIRFHFTRAAVGVGAPFGIGEDFAAASIWLARLGADPAELAAPALDGVASGASGTGLQADKRDGKTHIRPVEGPALSAIYGGPAAADRLAVASSTSKSGHFILENVDQPALVAAAVALAEIDGVQVSWPAEASGRCCVMLLGGGIGLLSGEELHKATSPVDVKIVLASPSDEPPQAHGITSEQLTARTRQVVEAGVAVAEEPWATVYAHFSKCLVPSTDESRLGGAGAGLTDND